MPVSPITSFPQFYDLINSGDRVTFVDFWAEWCGPCKAIKPVYERLSNAHGAVASFYSVDVGVYDDIAQEVRVTSVPTIMAFKDGNPIGAVVGADQEPVSAFVAKHAPVHPQ